MTQSSASPEPQAQKIDLGFELYVQCGTLVDTMLAKWRDAGIPAGESHHAVMNAYLSLITVYIALIGKGEEGRAGMVEIFTDSLYGWLDKHNGLMRQKESSPSH